MSSSAAPGTDAPAEASHSAESAGEVHRVWIPLRLADFVGGHVNNVRFQEFSQDARLMWFRETFDVPGSRVPIALARWLQIDFRRVIGRDASEVWVDVQVLRVGRTSYTMRTTIGSEVTGPEPCAVVDTVLVVAAADEATTLEITPTERAALLGRTEEAA